MLSIIKPQKLWISYCLYYNIKKNTTPKNTYSLYIYFNLNHYSYT